MAFQVPSLADVSRTIENGFSSSLYGKSGSLRVGVFKILSKVIAGGCYLPILFCSYIFRNSFIDTCDVENLVRFGGWYNLPHKVASNARGKVSITTASSVNIPTGTILIDTNTSDEYETLEPIESSSALTDHEFKVSAVNVGSRGNRASGVSLSFRDIDVSGASLTTNLISGGTSFDVSVNGVVEQWGESVEDYRTRLKYRRQHQPSGGSVSDFKQWAERFSQVTDAYVFGNYPTTNCVSVFCADFNSDGVILNDDELEEVEKYITSDSRKPLTSKVIVASVTPCVVGLTIQMQNIGSEKKNQVVEALKKALNGFGFGRKLTKEFIQKTIVENGIADTCTVTTILVGGVNYTSNGYTFKKEYSSGNLVGEIVNINKIESNLSLVVG